MLIADLSVDFDFFVREDPLWDFGHQESSLFSTVIWLARYTSLDLFAETDIERHADFAPERLLVEMRARGLKLKNTRRRRIGVADSHQHAYSFFSSEEEAPDLLLNLDAHHDFFAGSPDLDCSNWAAYLKDEWEHSTRFLQIYPSWKDKSLDSRPSHEVETHQWDKWAGFEKGEEVRIRNIFFCRSAAWVPPHHDARFVSLAQSFADLGEVEILEQMLVRPQPDRAEMARARKQIQESMQEVAARNLRSRELSEASAA